MCNTMGTTFFLPATTLFNERPPLRAPYLCLASKVYGPSQFLNEGLLKQTHNFFVFRTGHTHTQGHQVMCPVTCDHNLHNAPLYGYWELSIDGNLMLSTITPRITDEVWNRKAHNEA